MKFAVMLKSALLNPRACEGIVVKYTQLIAGDAVSSVDHISHKNDALTVGRYLERISEHGNLLSFTIEF